MATRLRRALSVIACAFAATAAHAVETPIAISASAIDFGNVAVGGTVTLSVTLTNTGTTPFGPINMFGGAPPSAEFNASQNCQATTLPPGGSCTVNYAFTPSGRATFTDTSRFTVSATSSQANGEDFTVTLRGTGVVPITVTPTSHDFGNVDVGSTATAMSVVRNTGSQPFGPLNMFGGAPPTAEFNASQNCQARTLPPNGTCVITYTFSPTSPGRFDDASSFTISATASQSDGADFTVTLRGCGVQPGQPCPGAMSTATTLSCSPNPANPGRAVTCTARVTGATGPGSVTFRVDGSPVATVPLDGTGRASFTTSSLALGDHAIVAEFMPTAATIGGSTSSALTLSVVEAVATRTAVEYFHAGFGHYFITAFPSEIELLDGGAFGGAWQRTGQTFAVWENADPGTSPVCRFFSASFAPRSSHFYTPFVDECETVKANPDWQYEAIAFHLKVPTDLGACPSGSAPLHRAYNNGMSGAPNHRYTTRADILGEMQALGWTPEGVGGAVVFACIPRD